MQNPKNPRNAGRKPLTDERLRKIPICLKLPRWLVEKMAEQPENRAQIIERAVRSLYGWLPPKS